MLVPVDTGNLRGSAYTRVAAESDTRIEINVGYTAHYAIYVHEDLTAAHGSAFNSKHADKIRKRFQRYRRKAARQQAKFLEQPMREGHAERVKAIRDAIRRQMRSAAPKLAGSNIRFSDK